MTADEMKMSMFYTYVQNRGFTYIPTHYIIGCNGDFVKVNEMDTIVGATLNEEANVNGIHIEIVGDFNQAEPNESQYKMLNQLIERILEKHPDMQIK
ncbi:MAG: N-acetylmuramoyl-L-alanine amidase [Methanobrevibacter sp.]|nr:N-acetylmuramoyl-L-alanine amidase [Methanobrevibacter sp.]